MADTSDIDSYINAPKLRSCLGDSGLDFPYSWSARERRVTPYLANVRAVARPMPEPAPVKKAEPLGWEVTVVEVDD
ncbi:hypothetical protein VC83_05470 [Pseudogymnoascus destructans]|uniref:Uncharacterized protein n=1 Tax=Pseudogymnoascus destructans TaxID=655981 RepID=A0A177A6T6_9PEZI|nr:uncharacterized protein VC83_05470 [Pseudogymnoascus destructans]OAF57876.1 hypothetical protein VC83_05470 [Pseudogymnoascus destructans]